MSVSWPQSAPIEEAFRRSAYPLLGSIARRHRVAVMPALVGFFCFLPYPALSIGGSSALQIGNVLSLLACLPLLLSMGRFSGRALWVYPLLLAPLFLSAVKVSISGGAEDGALCYKAIVVWAVSALTVMSTQIDAPDHAVDLLTGIAVATIVHAIVGAIQIYSFASGVFPFAEMYVNPSFLSVQDNAQIIARYTRRPFGIFPEPSAMSASLAPWVLAWAAEQMGFVRLRQQVARWQRWLFAVAAVAGLALIIASESGHAAVLLAALLLFTGTWFIRTRVTPRTILVLIVLIGVVLPCTLYFGAEALGERIGGKSALGNSSWEERSQSLVIGLNLLLNGNPLTGIFGMGAGMSAPALWTAARIDAVFSVLLTYVYETGLIGLVAVGAIGMLLLRTWKRVRYDMTFAVVFAVWLVGVMLTTSYQQLLPLWMTLAWLTVWPLIYAPPARVTQRAMSPSASFAARRNRWSDA